MAGQILATHTIDGKQGDVQKVYQAPVDSGITDCKLIINNYSPDNIVVYSVGAPGWELVAGVLQWLGSGTEVTEVDRKQRALFIGELEQYERVIEDGILLGDEDQIWAEGKHGICNIVLFGDIDSTAARVEELKLLVLNGTITDAEKEELMLLSGGAYQVNINTNNCSCP